MLDVRRLRVLREVAAHGSFSAAAFEMRFTPSAVSQHIAALERESGAQLVERSSRGVCLTPAGELVLEHAEVVLDRLKLAEQELRSLTELGSGRLRMACFHSGASTLVPGAMAAFRRNHPGVEVSLVEAHPNDAVARVRDGSIDLALVFNYDILTIVSDEDVRCQRLLEDPVKLALPARHRMASRGMLRLDDLREDAWIQTVTPSCSTFLTEAAKRAGFVPDIAFETDDYQAVLGLVAAGVGVALVPGLALGSPPAGVAVRPLADGGPVRFIEAALPPAPVAAADAMVALLEREAERLDQATPLPTSALGADGAIASSAPSPVSARTQSSS
jgi:DNA-binding transcriptional LysR family regulator